MTQPFLITGLPRSRTAWFSTLCSTGDAICYHEPMWDAENWHYVGRIWQRSQYRYQGIADAALGFNLEQILQRWAPRILIIERPLADVEASLHRAFPTLPQMNYCRLLAEHLQAVGEHPLVMRVGFEDLQKDGRIVDCWKHLLGNTPFDAGRIHELQHMNIQVDKGYLQRRLAARQPDLAAFLGEDVASRLKVL